MIQPVQELSNETQNQGSSKLNLRVGEGWTGSLELAGANNYCICVTESLAVHRKLTQHL